MERKLSSLDEAKEIRFDQRTKQTTYALQKIEGQVSVDRRKTVLEEGLSVGDAVIITRLPDGTCLLSKTDDPSALRIRRITAAYVQFDGEVSIKEI